MVERKEYLDQLWAWKDEQQRSRFCSVWQVIEEAELVDEY